MRTVHCSGRGGRGHVSHHALDRGVVSAWGVSAPGGCLQLHGRIFFSANNTFNIVYYLLHSFCVEGISWWANELKALQKINRNSAFASHSLLVCKKPSSRITCVDLFCEQITKHLSSQEFPDEKVNIKIDRSTASSLNPGF